MTLQIRIGRQWSRKLAEEGVARDGVARRRGERLPWYNDEDKRLTVIQWLFAAFVAFTLVNIPSGAADNEESRLIMATAIETGNTFKQIVYFASASLALGIWGSLRGRVLPRSVHPINFLFFLWIFCSVLWSADPALSIRRAVLLVTAFIPMCLAIDLLGRERSLAALYWVLAISSTIALASALLHLPFAIHPATESDPGIVGDWRGVFNHKNVAGAICSVAALLFFHTFLTRRRFYDIIFFAVCIIFLLGSGAKTPKNIIGVALVASTIYRFMYYRPLTRVTFVIGLVSVLFCLLLGYLAYQGQIAAIVGDPDSFTGRSGIWQAVLAYSADHRWFGAGYSALWATNLPPPILNYINAPYQAFILHSHNGYLELLGTLGIPGLMLGVTGALIIPLYQVFRDTRQSSKTINSIGFAVVLFCMIENMFETQLYSRDREIWLCLIVTVMCLQNNFDTLTRPSKWRRSGGNVLDLQVAAPLADEAPRGGWTRRSAPVSSVNQEKIIAPRPTGASRRYRRQIH